MNPNFKKTKDLFDKAGITNFIIASAKKENKDFNYAWNNYMNILSSVGILVEKDYIRIKSNLNPASYNLNEEESKKVIKKTTELLEKSHLFAVIARDYKEENKPFEQYKDTMTLINASIITLLTKGWISIIEKD